jgi:hypothetical protein
MARPAPYWIGDQFLGMFDTETDRKRLVRQRNPLSASFR